MPLEYLQIVLEHLEGCLGAGRRRTQRLEALNNLALALYGSLRDAHVASGLRKCWFPRSHMVAGSSTSNHYGKGIL